MVKQKQAGIIDLGTNTFHLLVARYDKYGNYEILERQQQPVKIGKGGIRNKQITPEAYERGMKALREFKRVLDNYPLDELRIIGTSALRSAENSKPFLDDIENLFKHGTQLIDGDQEANLICYGVQMAAELGEKPALILDIGGGSVELIIANNQEVFWKNSFEIGAARLIALFPHDFPIKKSQAQEIKDHIAKVLKPFQDVINQYPVTSLIGASGSFETFVQMEQSICQNDSSGHLPVLHAIDPNHFQSLKQKILNATKAELHQIPGMADFRVDMIVAATLIVEYIQELTGLTQVYFSDYAMKEGALWAFLNEEL